MRFMTRHDLYCNPSTENPHCPETTRWCGAEGGELPELCPETKKMSQVPPCSHWEYGWNHHFIWSPAKLDSRFQRPENHHSEKDHLAELPCWRDKATHGSLQTKDNAKRKVCSRHIGPSQWKKLDDRRTMRHMTKKSMAEMTRRLSSEKQPACLGHVPGSSCREMQAHNEGRQHYTSCNSRLMNISTATPRRMPQQAI